MDVNGDWLDVDQICRAVVEQTIFGSQENLGRGVADRRGDKGNSNCVQVVDLLPMLTFYGPWFIILARLAHLFWLLWLQSMSGDHRNRTQTRKQGSASLYLFTLKSHYERSIEQHPEYYRPPGEGDIPCARSPEQLQALMDHLDWNLFDEQDRGSEGLILRIDPNCASLIVASAGDQEPSLPSLIFAIPSQAIAEKTLVPQREVKFRVPVSLSVTESRSLRQKIPRIASGMLRTLAPACIIGVAIAMFPTLFPSESASRWLGYFLNNAPFLVLLLITTLAVSGCIYLLLLLSRMKVQSAMEKGVLDQFRQVLKVLEPFDPGLDLFGPWALFITGIVFLAMAVLGISLWYRTTPLPPVEFQIRQSGEPPYVVLSDTQVSLAAQGVMEIKVPLPPNVTHPSCRWDTSGEHSTIHEQEGCQAVYWARDTEGQDRVVVQIYQGGRQLARASLTVAVEPGVP